MDWVVQSLEDLAVTSISIYITFCIVVLKLFLAIKKLNYRMVNSLQGCEYEGEKYSEGDSFPHKDGCNECFCSKGGRIGCTMKSCQDQFIKRAINPSGCHYNGEWHKVGETYKAADGCNTCSCGCIILIISLASIDFVILVGNILIPIKSRVQ